ELRNVINRALIIARGDVVSMDCMPDYLKHEVNIEELESQPSPIPIEDEVDDDVPELAGVAGQSGKSKRGSGGNSFDPSAMLNDEDMTLENMERLMIKKLLEDHDGNKPLVADKLGVSLKTLYNKIRKYELQG